MKQGCLTLFVLLIGVVILINFPLFALGVALIVWGVYEYRINKKMQVKSRLIPTIIATGFILSISGCVMTISQDTDSDLQTADSLQENVKKADNNASVTPITSDDISDNDSTAITEEEKPKKTETPGDKIEPIDLVDVEFVRVIDGDTIKIIYEGKEESVRYLLIDTPETSHPQLGKQPFGEEAKARNQEILDSGKLKIEFDIGQKYDKYNRLLAYIYVDGKSVQEMLLREGLARVAYVYPPNTRHLGAFEKVQAKAKEEKLGIWSIENYATDQGFDSETHLVEEPETQKDSIPPKTNNTNKPAATPAPPAPKTEPKVVETEWFQNCTELRTKYPSGVSQDHPAYQSKMDRDKDGWACER